jgi:ribosomal protein S18 acetylase RimI-like enzyme
VQSGTVDVRMARDSDAAFVERLSGEVFSEYTPGAAPRTAAMTQADGARTLVATVDRRPAGFAVIRASGDVAHLDAIAVQEVQRGRGLGRRLLSAAEAEAERRGAKLVRLVTADANLAALELFFKTGYFIERRLRRYYPRGQDALRLVKRLGR